MPITPATLTPALTSSLQGLSIKGPSMPQLASAIGTAFPSFLATIPVVTAHTGVVGSGTGIGRVTIDPGSGTGILTGFLVAAGITGPSMPQLASGIITGLASEINVNAIVQVTITGTSTGTGIGTLAGARGSLFTQILTGTFLASGIKGSKANSLAQSIGQGVGTWLATGVINTVDTGTPLPPFNSTQGAGTGKVF